MASKHAPERLARLESDRDQHRRELDGQASKLATLESIDRKLDRLCASLASLEDWRRRSREQSLWLLRMAAFAALLIGSELASGAWGRIFGALARRLA